MNEGPACPECKQPCTPWGLTKWRCIACMLIYNKDMTIYTPSELHKDGHLCSNR